MQSLGFPAEICGVWCSGLLVALGGIAGGAAAAAAVIGVGVLRWAVFFSRFIVFLAAVLAQAVVSTTSS